MSASGTVGDKLPIMVNKTESGKMGVSMICSDSAFKLMVFLPFHPFFFQATHTQTGATPSFVQRGFS